jgi:flagellar biosynthesis/type III secretory pathway M-ring protein FliF/YscJ
VEWITPVLLVAATAVVAALGARKVVKALRADKAEKAASDTESDAAPHAESEDQP